MRDYYPKPHWSRTEIIVVIAIILVVACIPFGIGMALYMDDGSWLWFCFTLVFFLS